MIIRALPLALALASLTVSFAAEARGMYCTRHREACRQRDKAAADARKAYAAWYAALDDRDRRVEDARSVLLTQAARLRETARRMRDARE